MIKDQYGRKIKIGHWVLVWIRSREYFGVKKCASKEHASLECDFDRSDGHYSRFFEVKSQADLNHIKKITGQ